MQNSEVHLLLGHEITDDDLREFGVDLMHNSMRAQVDFALITDPPEDTTWKAWDLWETRLYPIIRNLGTWVDPEWKIISFRGSEKLVVVFWHMASVIKSK